DHSQEGVDYHLVQIVGGQELRLSPDVRGDLGDIVLPADPAYEDIDIRIRATKVFDPSEHRDTQTNLLDAVLPLKVRARLDLPVSLAASPIVGFGEGAVVRIDNTQASVEYIPYVRAVPDSEFVFGAGGAGLLAVDVEGAPSVYVKSPPEHPIWQDIEGF